MADEYVPPLSPNVQFVFKADPEYTPPLSPNIIWNFGKDDSGETEGYLKTNYMILLTM